MKIKDIGNKNKFRVDISLHAVLQSLQFWNQIIGERAKTFKFRDFTAI